MLHSSATLPADMLIAANQYATVATRKTSSLKIDYASNDDLAVTTTSGISINPSCRIEDVQTPDLIICPSLWRTHKSTVANSKNLLRLLAKQAQLDCFIASVGTGSVFLAAAGVLDGKAATTHWQYIDAFKRQYPAVNVKRKHLITKADNIYCASSINSIADLCCHFIELFYGARVARYVEGQFSPEIRRSFNTQGYMLDDALHADELIIEVQQWLHDNSHMSVSLKQCAQHFSISQRTLNRRFLSASSISPTQYLQQIRLASAKDLLRSSNLSISETAYKTGWSDPARFSAVFKRQTGFSPRAYRASTKGKLFQL
jgi:transcriptional regulator GlxA family with amidase domain